jgi:hypothetical protein
VPAHALPADGNADLPDKPDFGLQEPAARHAPGTPALRQQQKRIDIPS